MSSGAPGAAGPPDLVVRTRSSESTLQAGAVYRIGRDPKSDIVVADSRVSWRHGVLRLDGETWILEDVGSTNGTFIGGQRIDRVPIADDCVVHLGNPDDGPVLRCVPQYAASAPARPPPPRPPRPRPPLFPRPSAPRRRPPATGRCPVHRASPSCPRGTRAARLRPSRPSSPEPPAAGGPVIPPHLLPSVDRRPTSRMPLPVKALRIGRVPDNDLVLPDLDVSRHHAELRRSPTGAYEIVDLGSHNGTFVNGRRVSSAVLSETDLVSIGRSTFRLAGGELRQYVDDGQISFSAQDLVVQVGGGKILLNHVTLPHPGEKPGRRHRAQWRGQVDAARRADRDAPGGHRHRAVRQP